MSGMEQMLVENRVFNPPKAFAKQAAITSMDQYKAMCKAFDKDFNGTWARLAKENLFWKKPFTKVLDESKAPFYKWFEDGLTNASYNCIDRNIKNG
jgi:acetyl-CoA synthetase